MIDAAVQYISSRTAIRPLVTVVLGSGLGAFADEVEDAVSIPYAEIPGFPQSTAIGHAGKLILGKVSGVPTAVMAGRFHLYEGYSAAQAAFGVRVLGKLGAKHLVVTNAAGGIGMHLTEGCLVLITDHINLQGQSPLTGPNDPTLGPRFPDMTEAYSVRARDIAHRLYPDFQEGVYAALPGPSYETPAEIRYLRTIGADLIGMSTVPEVIAANHMGIEVLGISCVTNLAAGMSGKKLNHEEVLAIGERVRGSLVYFLKAVIPAVGQAVPPDSSHGASRDPLLEAATKARENAHAPYSHFKVGAAIVDSEGRVHTGCNVENATYGLTICAERVAIVKAVSEGAKGFHRIAVVADTETLTPPCGACRQILWEFCGDAELVLGNLQGKTETMRISDIFPRAFDASFL